MVAAKGEKGIVHIGGRGVFEGREFTNVGIRVGRTRQDLGMVFEDGTMEPVYLRTYVTGLLSDQVARITPEAAGLLGIETAKRSR